jgi:hypothetical protein
VVVLLKVKGCSGHFEKLYGPYSVPEVSGLPMVVQLIPVLRGYPLLNTLPNRPA